MNIKNIFRGDLAYQILYKLKSGMSIGIALTFKCNFNCVYCNMNIANGKPRKVKEVVLDQWKFMIDTFPGKLKEVYVSGGEPTLMRYCADLINHITGKKILVTLFTNLSMPMTLYRIKPSKYFRIETTLHPEINRDYCAYEFSKYEGELLVQAGKQEMPISVFRPGMIIGDSHTGEIKTFNSFYFPLKLYLAGVTSFLPANPDLHVNIVPVD